MSLNALQTSRIGKVLVKVTKDPPSAGKPISSENTNARAFVACGIRQGILRLPSQLNCALDEREFISFVPNLSPSIENVKLYLTCCRFIASSLLCITAVKDLATSIENRWRQMIEKPGSGGAAQAKQADDEGRSCHFSPAKPRPLLFFIQFK